MLVTPGLNPRSRFLGTRTGADHVYGSEREPPRVHRVQLRGHTRGGPRSASFIELNNLVPRDRPLAPARNRFAARYALARQSRASDQIRSARPRTDSTHTGRGPVGRRSDPFAGKQRPSVRPGLAQKKAEGPPAALPPSVQM